VPIRVFLVEDVQQMHGVLADLLGSIGDFEVVGVAPTEAEAKAWVDEHRGAWDLAVVDLILEQGSGMGVVSRCRDRHQHGTVVVLSDYATPGVRKHCLQLGADAVFQKAEDMQAFIAYCSALSESQAAAL
jgi:DNA-binding NarL/FixJ family response regulator